MDSIRADFGGRLQFLHLWHYYVFLSLNSRLQIKNDNTMIIETMKQNLIYFNNVILSDLLQFFI